MKSDLSTHISKQQEKAIFLSSVLRLLDACHGYQEREDLGLCLSSAAIELAEGLVSGLDVVNLPREGKA